ncbi:MAG: BatA domain-containing protein [Bacteroidota bacterium]
MHFVNPLFLLGLFGLAVPIIIHLFNFRKFKKVFFTNVKFIEELQQRTQKQSQLRHLLILLLRILAITALVFAFAQPFIPVSKTAKINKGTGAVSVFVDNSFSMEADAKNGTLLDEARNKAVEVAQAYRPDDLFHFLTNDFEGKHQRLVTRDEFREMLEELKSSPSVKKLSEIIRRQSDMLSENKSKSKNIYVISDFQKSITDISAISADTSASVYLVPVKANSVNNLYIDSCWFESPVHLPGQNVKLFILIKNAGKTELEKVPLKFSVNGTQKAVSSFNISPAGEVQVVLTYSDKDAGIMHGVLEIMDSPVTYDDRFYIAYNVASSIPILCINGGSNNIYLNSLFAKDSAFTFKNISVNATDFSVFPQQSLIILNAIDNISSGLAQELQRFVQNGGSMLVVPSPKIDLLSYQEFLKGMNAGQYSKLNTANQKISLLNLTHPVFRDVFDYLPENMDLPSVFSWYGISGTSSSGQEFLMKMQNGDVFMSGQTVGQGTVYLLAVPLETDYSNFPKHALFVPALYKVALLSEPQNKLYYVIGRDEPIEVRKVAMQGEMVFKVKGKTGDNEFIPEQKKLGTNTTVYVHDQIRDAGNYALLSENSEVTGLAFNYDRKESVLSCYTAAELEDMCSKAGLKNFTVLESSAKPLADVISEMNQGIKLWKIFIILALVFLAGEALLLRFRK